MTARLSLRVGKVGIEYAIERQEEVMGFPEGDGMVRVDPAGSPTGTFTYRVDRIGRDHEPVTRYFTHRPEDGIEKCVQLALGVFVRDRELRV